MKEIKFESKAYSPKSFGIEELQESLKGINDNPDTKRTICNVLRMAYNCMQDEAINANAARSLILEAFWMGKRMRNKLGNNAKHALKQETPEHVEEFMFSVDWNEDVDLSQGNWD